MSVLELDAQWDDAVMKQYEAKLDWIKAYCKGRQLLGYAELKGETI